MISLEKEKSLLLLLLLALPGRRERGPRRTDAPRRREREKKMYLKKKAKTVKILKNTKTLFSCWTIAAQTKNRRREKRGLRSLQLERFLHQPARPGRFNETMSDSERARKRSRSPPAGADYGVSRSCNGGAGGIDGAGNISGETKPAAAVRFRSLFFRLDLGLACARDVRARRENSRWIT